MDRFCRGEAGNRSGRGRRRGRAAVCFCKHLSSVKCNDPGVVVEPGQSPHSYEPTPSQVVALGEADILFTIGVEFERAFLPKIEPSLPDLSVVQTRAGIKLRGEKILVFHPAFGYFADEFGLVQEAIETGGNEPSPKQLEKIISEAKAEDVRVIFVQPQFSKSSAEAVANAIGGAVIAINPLAADWFSNMRKIADTISSPPR